MKQIILDDGQIQDFTGVGIFTALRDFCLVRHKITISPLDLSANTNLQLLQIEGENTSCGVGSININGCTELEQLHLRTNHLTALDLSTNSKLTKIYCDNNQLTTLDLSGCPNVKQVYCFQNQITGEGMDNLIANLPTRAASDGVMSIVNSNAEAEGNSMTTLQVAAAKEKGWATYNWAGGLYAGVKVDPALAYAEAVVYAKMGEPFTAPELTNPYGVAPAYSSSDANIASVDAATGTVTLLKEGATTITATYAEDDIYTASQASYKLIVEEVNGIIQSTTNSQQPTTTYNLHGQRVGRNYRGIVLINGKKVKK